MKKGNHTNLLLMGLTLVFIFIAVFSFAAFQETDSICTSEVNNCNQQVNPAGNGGEILWDSFPRWFVSLVIK